jgi:exodeoxyribonuclease-3
LEWLATAQPDILGLQELKLENKDFPLSAITEAGYHAIYSGQKTWNGVAILSKIPATNVITDIPDFDDPQRRLIGATISGLRLFNLYVPNGEAVGSDKYHYKLAWLNKLNAFIKTELQSHPYVAVMGDFNIAPDDRDIYDPVLWEGKVLASENERNALRELFSLGFSDTFRLFEQTSGHYSWWDYRAGAFHRNQGLRIDHILANKDFAQQCRTCIIDKLPRHAARPSDHTPVIATFDI